MKTSFACNLALLGLAHAYPGPGHVASKVQRRQDAPYGTFPAEDDPFRFIPCTNETVPPRLADQDATQTWQKLFNPDPSHWSWGSRRSGVNGTSDDPFRGRGICKLFFLLLFNNIFCFSSHSFIHHTMLTVTASGRPLWLSRRPIRLQERVRKSHLPLGCEQIPGIRAGSCRFRLIDGRQEERADSCDQPRRPRWKRSAVCCVGGRGALGKDERRCHGCPELGPPRSQRNPACC